MKIERFSFSGTAGNALEAYIWSPDSEPKVVLQVTHGMTEHMGRYEKLAEELAAQGVVTAGFDLPGHGRNPGGQIAPHLESPDGNRPLQICTPFQNSCRSVSRSNRWYYLDFLWDRF